MNSKFADLYEKTIQNFQEGEIVKATVVDIRGNDVMVDIGYKAEGIIGLDEFTDPSKVQVGFQLDVLFESFDDEQGAVIVSKRKADRLRTWNRILEDSEEGSIVEGRILRKVRGGFMVDIGMEAFLPASLVDLKPTRNLDQFLGVVSKFMIVKINHKRKNIVVSRKDFLEKEKAHSRLKRLETLTVGDRIKGRVKNITDFGVFLDLGELDGLLHITDMSWGRVSHPSELVKLGDEIEVVVISIDKESGRVSLGLKQKLADPWDTVEDKYTLGRTVSGKVVNILPYGAFIELEPGIEGLVHISELSWTKRLTHPSDLLKISDQVDVVVLSLDREGKKISLGMKQIQENPWSKVGQRYLVGEKAAGKVRNLTDYGAFVELEPGVDGLIHISDISWTHKVQHPSEILKKGQEIEVMVLGIDPEAQKISLGLKQLSDDPWEKLTKELHTGTPMTGKVNRIANFGLFIELENGLEGLVHVSELPESNPADLEKKYVVNDSIEVSILTIDHDARKIALTCKDRALSSKDS